MPNSKEKKIHLLRPLFWVGLAVALCSLIVHLISMQNAVFADAIGKSISPVLRATLGYLTALFPLSIAEMLLVLLPFWVLLLFLMARHVRNDRLRSARMLSALLAVPLFLYSVFVLSLAVQYYTPALSERMEMEEHEISAEDLYQTAVLLAQRAAESAEEAGVSVGEKGSFMPFSYQQMNLLLLDAYETLDEQYDFIHHFDVGTKPVLLSDAMAYTHITGVYSFFTGEMNVCTAFTDFCTVFTAAHEMAHARGIAREDEANFVAFLACEASDNPYIRYAGYTSLLQYVTNALYDTDKTLFTDAWQFYSDVTAAEFRAYNTVYKKYADTVASDIAGSINNAYLEGMGTEGSISYDLVVRLGVWYLVK